MRYSSAAGEPLNPKTPNERAWSSGKVPFAFGVVATGMFNISANSRTSELASDAITPEPTSIAGFFAVTSFSVASITNFRSKYSDFTL